MACQCGRCRPIGEKVLPHFTMRQRGDAVHEPVFLGLFRMNAWKYHERLYLFTCRKCLHQTIGFVCFYDNDGLFGALHLHCGRCWQWPHIIQSRQPYDDLGVPFPDPGEINAAMMMAEDLGASVCATDAGSRP